MNTGSNRLYGIDILRIYACFSLLPFHYCTYGQMLAPLSYQYANEVIKTLFGFHVPLFLMIGGALFLGKEHIDIKRLFSHNIAHIVLVYFFWSAVYGVFDIILNIGNVRGLRDLLVWFVMDIRDSHYHLWYLPMIVGIYILVPLLHAAVGNGRNPLILKYISAVFTIFGVILYTLLLLPVKADTYHTMLTKVDVGSFSGWLGFFVVGYYLFQNRNEISEKLLKILVGLSIISFIVVILVNIANVPKEGVNTYISYFSIPCFIIECTLFLVFVRIQDASSEKKRILVASIADCMLGTYCIHDIVMSLIHMIFSGIPDRLFVIRIVIVVPISFAISVLIVFILRKNKVMRKVAV